MRCDEMMKREVECVSPRDTIQAAARRMRDENVGFLPVCDGAKKVIGTITDRDLAIRALGEGLPGSTFVEAVLTREVVACRPEDDLRRAQELMAKNHKSRIMCIDGGGRLQGVISLSDIAQREDGAHASQTLRAVSEREIRA
ncbi:MAG: CBS domain-containing protein [Deltaproteobacteria bacterium]